MKPRDAVRPLCLLLAIALLAGACASTSASPDDRGESPGYLDSQPERLVLQPLVPKSTADLDNQLYGFAHIILPRVVFMNPEDKVREQFLGASADHFLEVQWAALHAVEPDTYPTAEAVELAGGVEAALIEMPPPQDQAHAYFTLVAFTDGGVRYFTLEHSAFREGGTVLGGWTMDGGAKHLNYGEGPAPEKKPFLTAVEKLLE